MRIQYQLIICLFFIGVIISGCDNRKSETIQKNVSSSSLSQTQNIQSDPAPSRTKEEQEAWKKATDTSGHDFNKYSKPLP